MITKEFFGTTKNGQAVHRYTLARGGLTVQVLDYGARIQSILVPGRDGPVDVVLGYDDLAGYEADPSHLGAFVGRVANRVEKGRFTLNGTEYQMSINNGPNHCHGVWDQQVLKAEIEGETLLLRWHSPAGEDGLPGTVDAEMRYTLDEQGGLTLDYRAVTDADTPINLTNHSYFNLAGGGSVLDQTLQLYALRYTPADAVSCPTGEVLPVAGTPMDFIAPKPIGRDIEADFDQLRWAGGFDHNWCIDGEAGVLRPAAFAHCEATGITLACETTQPGIQFYSGNYLDGRRGKAGAVHQRRSAFCLETQHYPCSVNRPQFPSIILHPGEEYHEVTVYRFGLK